MVKKEREKNMTHVRGRININKRQEKITEAYHLL